jgi:hypothetical protein
MLLPLTHFDSLPNTAFRMLSVWSQANRETGKNMATLNNKFIFFALTSEC